MIYCFFFLLTLSEDRAGGRFMRWISPEYWQTSTGVIFIFWIYKGILAKTFQRGPIKKKKISIILIRHIILYYYQSTFRRFADSESNRLSVYRLKFILTKISLCQCIQFCSRKPVSFRNDNKKKKLDWNMRSVMYIFWWGKYYRKKKNYKLHFRTILTRYSFCSQ